jgi:hypothetical protein
MNKINHIATAAILATGLSISAQAEATQSTESINTASNKIEVVKNAVCANTNVALACHKAGLEMPKNKEISSKEIREYLISL